MEMSIAMPTSKQSTVCLSYLLVMASIIFGQVDSVVAAENTKEDRTAKRVQVAEERFEKSVQRVAEKLSASLEEEIKIARADGELNKLVALQEEKRLYDDKQLIPRHSSVSSESKRYYRTLDREGDRLESVYESAIVAYTQSSDLKNAKEIQGRMEWLRPMKGLNTIEFGDHYYLLIEETVSWQNAQSRCHEMGGYLGCVNSAKENLLFHRLAGEGRYLWLGFSDDEKEGRWVGTDGSVMKYENWQPGEPNGGREINWAVMMPNGKWDDIRSQWGNVKAYVCEWDHKITRRTLENPADTDLENSPEVQTIKTETLKHNELIVKERKMLQEAILNAEEEEAIVQAKSNYRQRVASIKEKYIEQLNGALKNAIAADQLQLAGKIKTQIIRVKNQLAHLAKAPDEEKLDQTDTGEVKPDDSGAITDDEEHQPADNSSGKRKDDGAEFFGIPLE